MASPKDPKVDVAAAGADKEKLAMLKELAKLTKPTGASSKGKAMETGEEE